MKIIIGILFCVLLLSTKANSQDIPDFYFQIDSLYAKNKFQECIALEAQVEAFIQQRKDTLGNNVIVYLADSYHQLDNPAKAIEWSEKQHTYLANTSLLEEFSIALFNLGNLYLEVGDYIKAGKIADELLIIDKKLFGESSPDYVTTVINVADFYLKSDRLEDSKSLLKSNSKKHKKTSFEFALLMNKLGDLYTYTGEYSRAFNSLTDALEIFKKDTTIIGKQHYSSTSANLGILSMERGKYPDAEQYFDKALNSFFWGDSSYHLADSSYYMATLNNLAIVYQRLGQYETAEKEIIKLENHEKINLGENHPSYAVTLTNLSMVYKEQGKFAEAEKTMLKAIEIQKSNESLRGISYASKLNNLGQIYLHSGSPAKAIPYYLEVLEIFKKTLGTESFSYSTASYNLGLAYLRIGRRQEGIKLIRESANIRAKVLGKRHPKYAESIEKIAEYQWQRRQKKSARATFGEVFDNYYFQIETFFPVLTEEEKAKFYYTTLKPTFDKFNSFALDFYREDPTVAGDVYNIQMRTKAVVMLATEKVKNAIKKSNNPALIEKFNEWQALKEKIAKLYSQNEDPSKTDSLVLAANEMEKELGRESADFSKQIVRKKVTWQDVQKKLKPGEAAIEVVRFNAFTTAEGGKFDNKVSYGFLIVTNETKEHPDFIVMEDGYEMENRSLKFYRNSIQNKIEDTYSYATYFEPVGDYLIKNKITTFYFSPDGVYNQINLNTLFDPNLNKFLNDEYTIIQVTNTTELLDNSVKKNNNTSSILIGFPTFNIKHDTDSLTDNELAEKNSGESFSRSLRGGLVRYVSSNQGIPPLPGTEKEIQELSKLFKKAAQSYTANAASENTTKQAKNPRVLHIATHGYFLEDESTNSSEGNNKYIANPLLRSGLILAGVENFLKTGIPIDSTGEDGILTAYEAMNLQLEETDLVVLSACETARGDVKNGEGVYGLQRALKLSGSQCVIMSLWSVDDEATLQLMVSFYENFLQSNNAHDAMRKAQNKLKETYPNPFYWGAFVVIGI
jgi:CHAT domain-containing protein/Tfp pilus assembly protein PilF